MFWSGSRKKRGARKGAYRQPYKVSPTPLTLPGPCRPHSKASSSPSKVRRQEPRHLIGHPSAASCPDVISDPTNTRKRNHTTCEHSCGHPLQLHLPTQLQHEPADNTEPTKNTPTHLKGNKSSDAFRDSWILSPIFQSCLYSITHLFAIVFAPRAHPAKTPNHSIDGRPRAGLPNLTVIPFQQ